MKQSTLGSISSILHPLTEVRGRKICSNGQQAKSVKKKSTLGSISTILYLLTEVKGRNGQQVKSVDRSSILSPDKT